MVSNWHDERLHIDRFIPEEKARWLRTLFHLKASIDGSTYYYIEQNIVPEYLMNEDYSTYWFENATDGRYWTIEPVHGQYVGTPFIGGDFIGYLWAIAAYKKLLF